MFVAQLSAFLAAHHHLIWSQKITTSTSGHTFDAAYHWAQLKGFVFTS